MVERSKTVSVMLPNGVAMNVEAVGVKGSQDVGLGDRLFGLEEVSSALTGLAELARDAIAKSAPDTASVEFGLDMALEAGKLTALLVSGSATASLKVTLGWESAKAADPGDPRS